MNIDKIKLACDRMECCADRLQMACASESIGIRTAVQSIREEMDCGGGNIRWNLRGNPPVVHRGRYLCRYIFEHTPEMPFYMALGWNEEDAVPHFDNEMPGLTRVTHWAEINEPEGERA